MFLPTPIVGASIEWVNTLLVSTYHDVFFRNISSNNNQNMTSAIIFDMTTTFWHQPLVLCRNLREIALWKCKYRRPWSDAACNAQRVIRAYHIWQSEYSEHVSRSLRLTMNTITSIGK